MKLVVSITSLPPPPLTFSVSTSTQGTVGAAKATPLTATLAPAHVTTMESDAASEFTVSTSATLSWVWVTVACAGPAGSTKAARTSPATPTMRGPIMGST